jgi:quercetin dioxygenase-like cupin family protein
MKILTAEQHSSRPGAATWFTGSVWVTEIKPVTAPSRIHALWVWFGPDSRTAWHTHPNGQTLHVLNGLGVVQLAGSPPSLIRPGDTVWIEPEERHWHGSAPGRTMVHLALQEADPNGKEVEWFELVTDNEYAIPAI